MKQEEDCWWCACEARLTSGNVGGLKSVLYLAGYNVSDMIEICKDMPKTSRVEVAPFLAAVEAQLGPFPI